MVDYSRFDFVKVEKKDRVAIITLNSPETLNAVFAEEHHQLEDVLEEVDKDMEANSIILTGAGHAFSAGGDVKRMLSNMDDDLSKRMPMSNSKRLLRNLLELRRPIVAAVNGDALGVGATLALCCDLVIVSEDARIGDPHISVGLVPGDGGCVIWPLLTSFCKAKEYLMTGKMMKAAEAERIGLVNRVVSADKVQEEAWKVAKRLADGPIQALCWTKTCINKILLERMNLLMDAGVSYEYHSMFVPDHREAIQAFAEKRTPKYKGGPI